MTVTYKFRDRAKLVKLEQNSYRVLGYGEQLNGSRLYTIVNDALQIISLIESAVDVIDSDLNGYVRKDQQNYNRTLLIDDRLSHYLNHFTQYQELESSHIWNLSKLSRFLLTTTMICHKNTKTRF